VNQHITCWYSLALLFWFFYQNFDEDKKMRLEEIDYILFFIEGKK